MSDLNKLADVLVALMLLVGVSALSATLIVTLLNVIAPNWLALNFLQCMLLTGTALLIACWIQIKREVTQKKKSDE